VMKHCQMPAEELQRQLDRLTSQDLSDRERDLIELHAEIPGNLAQRTRFSTTSINT
ncbi:hypothetical protein GBF38_019588, partial [Nibea albiflora]